jgi:hypothetical protein
MRKYRRELASYTILDYVTLAILKSKQQHTKQHMQVVICPV